MRTTLTIDDDVLMAVRHMADLQKRTVGEVLSDLARQALAPRHDRPRERNGILLLPNREDAAPVTLELVNRLRDEAP
ncbi:CopG family transcriptional regulator [Phenylobacterium sp.]|uniref:CopG family transcriptional regulator n=1 Tax=Phenylobacterium sp. TaxID=1871053 RepID=UPI00301CF191